MRKPMAYMLTWTTYGSWLQGDFRGYVKDGIIHEPNHALSFSNRSRLRYPTASLTPLQCRIVKEALYQEAEELGQKICAIAVNKNHIHLTVTANGINAGVAVSHYKYKNTARPAVQQEGFVGRL